MSALHRWLSGAVAVVLGLGAGAAIGEEEASSQPEDVMVVIPYAEEGELRVGEAWRIDCGTIGTLPGVEISCESDRVELRAEQYDPAWGVHDLPVAIATDRASLRIVYRVRMGAPPAPEPALTRLEIPLTVGAQAMIPWAAVGIVCERCTAEGGATVRIAEPEPETPSRGRRDEGPPPVRIAAGVSETHLTVRGASAGTGEVSLVLTDDAGQEVRATVQLFFVDGPLEPAALHVVSDAAELSWADLAGGSEVGVSCGGAVGGIRCDEVGVSLAGVRSPAQLAFVVTDAAGRQALGSVTLGAAGTLPAAPSWEKEAALTMVLPVPEQEDDDPSGVVESVIERMREVGG